MVALEHALADYIKGDTCQPFDVSRVPLEASVAHHVAGGCRRLLVVLGGVHGFNLPLFFTTPMFSAPAPIAQAATAAMTASGKRLVDERRSVRRCGHGLLGGGDPKSCQNRTLQQQQS